MCEIYYLIFVNENWKKKMIPKFKMLLQIYFIEFISITWSQIFYFPLFLSFPAFSFSVSFHFIPLILKFCHSSCNDWNWPRTKVVTGMDCYFSKWPIHYALHAWVRISPWSMISFLLFPTRKWKILNEMFYFSKIYLIYLFLRLNLIF